MKNGLRNIAITLLLVLPAAGCSTSAISTYGSSAGQTNSASYRVGERGQLQTPKSDHVSLKGDSSKQHVSAGKEHFINQNYGLAEESFRKAVEIRSDSASGWLGLAASLDQLGRFEFADRAYRQLGELKANNAQVLNNMGYSYLLRGDYQKARQYLNRAQAVDPSLEEVEGNLHLLEKVVTS